MKLHPSITMDRIFDAVRDEQETLANPGFCVLCGEDAEGCEPDLREAECEACGEAGVYGAEEVLLWVVI